MNVARVTVMAMIHGLISGRPGGAKLAFVISSA
jgi:hypothetical protein